MKRFALLFALLAGCSSSPSEAPANDTGGEDAPADTETVTETGRPMGTNVTTDKGPVVGVQTSGVLAFYDIPYAAAPTGDLRWKPPQPRAPWTEVRDATKRGVACPQGPDPVLMKVPDNAEDCLALNVWTPSLTGKLPVMVFVHGGSFTSGSGNYAFYDGTNLAQKNVVTITINYRLGALGYLAHPLLTAESDKKSSGNYGFLDQQAALAWVKANAEKFGGDPGNVTLFGESAGAISTCIHVVSPLAKGLFHRAISESGTCTLVNVPLKDPGTAAEDSMEERGTRFAKDIGCSDLACMRAKPVDALLTATTGGGIGTTELGIGPNIDGWVVPSNPRQLLVSGPANDVPYIIGTNGDEGNLFTQSLTITTAAQYEALVKAGNPLIGDQLLAIWKAADYPTPKDAYNALIGEGLFVCPARHAVRAVSKRTNAWLYHFEHVPPVGKTLGLGSFHSAELFFVFGNFDGYYTSPTTEELALSATMEGYWTRFAKAADPNGAGALAWPKYDAATDQHIVFETTTKIGSGLAQAHCDALDKIVP
ncbi:MAG: carboxylesterase/lipase family protein [Polyangiales bacterium]